MHHHLDLRTKIIIMLSVMAGLFLVALDQTIFATSVGKIVEEFNAFSSLSWVVTAYLLTSTISLPIAGKLSDLYGRRLMLLIGILIFVAGSLMGGMSGSMNQLILWRALEGVGAGIITANAFTIVGDLFAPRERGRWQGFFGASFGIATVIGPILGGYLTESHNIFGLVTNWRWTLFVNVPVGILAFIVIFIYCPTLKHEKKPKVDYAGALSLAVALAVLVLAIDNTKDIFASLMSWTGIDLVWLRIIMFTIVAIATAIFVAIERRAKEPLLPMFFFKNRNFDLIMVISLFFGAAFLGMVLYLTQFNQQVFGASPTQSGFMLMPLVGGIVFSSIGGGILISRTGKYKIFMQLGGGIATIAIIFLTALNPSSSFMYEAIVTIFLGIGLGVVLPVINLAVQNEFSQDDIGVATSSSQLFRNLGSTIGVSMFGAILTAGIISGLGDTNKIPYLQTLSQNPAASKIGSFSDSDTLLNLNMPDIKSEINAQAQLAFVKLPVPVRVQVNKQFQNQQNNFSSIVVHAFSDGMHNIFIVSAALMAGATVVAFAVKEKILRTGKPLETPGEL
ncbi:MAG TPA: MDR family MFS transporter [Candidatus Saccharimonadales bacterium]|nr:MDR family MFS transporter [Candidatus Saccharimonadales bacterium]